MQLNGSRSKLWNDETTFDLSRHRHDAVPDKKLSRPRDVNHWVIPAAVVTSALLSIYAVHHLIHDTEQMTDTTTMLFTAAVVMVATTALYIKAYALHRSVSQDHQMILDELRKLQRQRRSDAEDVRAQVLEVRKRLVLAGGENRALLGQILGKLENNNAEHWQALAAGVRIANGQDADVVPLPRRPGSYSSH